MKKIAALILVFIFTMLMFTGCVNSRGKTVSGGGNGETITAPLAYQGGMYGYFARSDEGLYERSSSRGPALVYYDYATGLKTALCSSPGCAHSDESCPAYFDNPGLISVYINPSKTRLLLFTQEFISFEEPHITRLISTDLTGGDRKTIARYSDADYAANFAGFIAVSDNAVYFENVDYSKDYLSVSHYIMRTDFESGETIKLFKIPSDMYLCHAFGSTLYLASYESVSKTNIIWRYTVGVDKKPRQVYSYTQRSYLQDFNNEPLNITRDVFHNEFMYILHTADMSLDVVNIEKGELVRTIEGIEDITPYIPDNDGRYFHSLWYNGFFGDHIFFNMGDMTQLFAIDTQTGQMYVRDMFFVSGKYKEKWAVFPVAETDDSLIVQCRSEYYQEAGEDQAGNVFVSEGFDSFKGAISKNDYFNNNPDWTEFVSLY